jgi:hypothetical protein
MARNTMPHLRPLLIAALLLTFAVSSAGAAPAPQAAPQRVYLPVLRGGALPSNKFGIEMSQLTTERGLRLMTTSGTRWVRRGALHWKLVEPTEGGGYSWEDPAIKSLEQDMITASQLGLSLIVTVYASPRWATEPHAADCAPINPDHTDEFARFMAAAARRYAGPPYNMRYWEIGNEPDAPIFATDSVFGCWGVEGDPYYGGRAYGEMLKQVYPAIKAAHPNVQVLNGGLLLDKPYNPADPKSRMGRFFEGVLVAGAGASFDLLSFHAYTFWRTPGQPALGPREDWRLTYLRDLMARYGVPEKPMLRTEGALLCPGEITPECRWAQADYLSRIFVRSLRDNLHGNLWYVYDNDSYHNTALIEPGDVLVPRPGYFAYRQASTLLASARYVGPLAGVPADVEGYVLRVEAGHVVALWSDSPRGFSLPLPLPGSVRCFNRDGGPIDCPVDAGRVSLELQTGAIYVVIAP